MIKITIPELKELCKQNGLKGYSKLNKGQLIDYLSSYAESDQGSGLFDFIKKIKTFFKKKTPPKKEKSYLDIPNPKWDYPMDERDASDILEEQFRNDESEFIDDVDSKGNPIVSPSNQKKFNDLREKHNRILKKIRADDLGETARQIEEDIDQSLTQKDYKDILEKHEIYDPVRAWPAQKIQWKQYKPLLDYLGNNSSGGRKKFKKSKKGKKMVKKSIKGGRMIGYGRDFYGAGLFDTIKSIAKKIPFAQIANVALEIAKEFLPNGKAKEIVDIAADITNKMVKEKEKEKEKEIKKEINKEEKKVEKEEEELISAPKKKIVLRRKAPVKARKVIKSKKPKKY